MKILLSGSTGFIGRHLIKRLSQNKYKLHAIIRPTSNFKFLNNHKVNYFIFNNNLEDLKKYFDKEKFDGIIHLATMFLNNHTLNDLHPLIQSNIYLPTVLLDIAVRNNVTWFINTGTQWQYFQNKTYSPINLYSSTKQAFESIAQYYIESSNINFVTLILGNTFGPYDTRYKIFDAWYNAAKTQKSLNMSPGNQILDMIYIDNVIDAFQKTINLISKSPKNKFKNKKFRVSSNEYYKLKKLAELFETTTNLKLKLNWGKVLHYPRQMMSPLKKYPLVPNWKPKISVIEGIKKTYTLIKK